MTKLDPRSPTINQVLGPRGNPSSSGPLMMSGDHGERATADVAPEWPLIPWARGPLSTAVIDALQRGPGTFGTAPPVEHVDVLVDDDFQLALYLCFEAHFRGFNGADWEWDAKLLRFRAELEEAFESRLRDEVSRGGSASRSHALAQLGQLIQDSSTSALVSYVDEFGNVEQLRELCVHQSVAHLHAIESHSLAIAHLTGEAMNALVDIGRNHQDHGQGPAGPTALFGGTMVALGLDPSSGSYVEMTPGVTLAMANLASMFALHRRSRAAFVGQLAIREGSSALSMQGFVDVFTKFGISPEGRRFFDVYADVAHRNARIARERMVTGFLASNPELVDELVFGATAMSVLEGTFATHVRTSWEQRITSLVPWTMFDHR